MTDANAPETVAQTLNRLKEEHGWAWPDVDRHTSLSSGTIRAIASGNRRPSLAMMEMIAEDFAVNPTRWPEFRLARARQQLDERPPPDGVGTERAMLNLTRVETLLLAAEDLERELEGDDPPADTRAGSSGSGAADPGGHGWQDAARRGTRRRRRSTG